MNTFFRALAFLVAVCCLTWLGVLWWWQRSGHSPDVSDLVIFLGLLPLAMALVLVVLRWLWRHRTAGASLAAAGTGEAQAAVAAPPDLAEAAARHAVMQVVRVVARSVAGEQPADLLEAAAAGKPLPQPEAELTNDDGMPVLCARVPDKVLALDQLRAELDELHNRVLRETVHAMPLETGDHVLRALALLKPLIESQREDLWALHQTHLATLPDGGASLLRLPTSQRPPLPALTVLLALPAHWPEPVRALALAWAEQTLLGEDGQLATAYAVSCTAWAETAEELWLRADRMGQGRGWQLLMGCDSDLSAQRIDELQAARQLYDVHQRPGGCMPGEAAAALLLAPPAWTPPADADVKTVRVHRPALQRRDKPVESSGRVGHRELAEVLDHALAAAQLVGADLELLVTDADQHSPRGAELYGMAVQALPELDPVEDMRLLGRVTGRTGVASALLVLAAAADAVAHLKKPVLALAMGDPRWRLAVVLKPSAEEAQEVTA